MTDLITPPLGWVLDLLNEARKRAKSSGCFGEVDYVYMVNKSVQCGWDQRGAATEAELQQRACCEWIRGWYGSGCGELISELRAGRRPTKPPSLKEQAYDALDTYIYGEPDPKDKERTYNAIRQALEALPND